MTLEAGAQLQIHEMVHEQKGGTDWVKVWKGMVRMGDIREKNNLYPSVTEGNGHADGSCMQNDLEVHRLHDEQMQHPLEKSGKAEKTSRIRRKGKGLVSW